jgi:polar amino acid transport system substrate-binding protein
MGNRFIIFAVALATFTLTAGSAMARDFSQIIASGQLRIAIASEDFLPWIGRGENGELLGFEADVATKLAEDLGVEVHFVERPFGDLIGTLTAKEVDIIISGLSITAERARRVLFSRPYGQSDLDLVISIADVPEGAADEAYDMTGMKIAVIEHTTSEFYGRDRFRNSEIAAYPDRNTARDAFLGGEVNAMIATKPFPAFIKWRYPDTYAVIGAPLTSTVEAAAVHPDNPRLLNYIDSWISEAMANGFLEAATHHWFETLDWTDQIPGLTEQIELIIEEKASGGK